MRAQHAAFDECGLARQAKRERAFNAAGGGEIGDVEIGDEIGGVDIAQREFDAGFIFTEAHNCRRHCEHTACELELGVLDADALLWQKLETDIAIARREARIEQSNGRALSGRRGE